MSKNSQSGNAIIIIFVAIALFAALTLAFNNSSRTSSNFIGDSAADSFAGQIIQLMSLNRSAARKLELRNCAPTRTSFEGAGGGFDYSPFGVTVPAQCEMFSSTGGGLNYQPPPALALDQSFSSEPEYGHVLYTKGVQVDGAGSYAVAMLVPFLKQDVCMKINEKLYGTSVIPEDSNNNYAISVYRAGETIPVGNPYDCETTHFAGNECADKIGCFRANIFGGVPDVYVGIQTLVQDTP